MGVIYTTPNNGDVGVIRVLLVGQVIYTFLGVK